MARKTEVDWIVYLNIIFFSQSNETGQSTRFESATTPTLIVW